MHPRFLDCGLQMVDPENEGGFRELQKLIVCGEQLSK